MKKTGVFLAVVFIILILGLGSVSASWLSDTTSWIGDLWNKIFHKTPLLPSPTCDQLCPDYTGPDPHQECLNNCNGCKGDHCPTPAQCDGDCAGAFLPYDKTKCLKACNGANCSDNDGDGYGVGSDCAGPDCNDNPDDSLAPQEHALQTLYVDSNGDNIPDVPLTTVDVCIPMIVDKGTCFAVQHFLDTIQCEKQQEQDIIDAHIQAGKTCKARYPECDSPSSQEQSELCLQELPVCISNEFNLLSQSITQKFNDCMNNAHNLPLDCNGCIDAQTVSCGHNNVGECKMGIQTCSNNAWGDCVGAIFPKGEVCDSQSKDENCNGLANEGCECSPGETRDCYTGPAGTENVGICVHGTQTCDSSGKWGEDCVGQQTPKTEVCDGQDDNCDGPPDAIRTTINGVTVDQLLYQDCYDKDSNFPVTDAAHGMDSPQLHPNNPEGTACKSGTQQCDSTKATSGKPAWGDCKGTTGPLSTEYCDGTNSKCDNVQDIGDDNVQIKNVFFIDQYNHLAGPDNVKKGTKCYPRDPSELSVPATICKPGSWQCVQLQTGGIGGQCEGAETPNSKGTEANPNQKATDGTACNGLDEDCNGQKDNGVQDKTLFTGDPKTENVGACKDGIQHCNAGMWITTQTEIKPVEESTAKGDCNDGIDNNCNTLKDSKDPGCASGNSPKGGGGGSGGGGGDGSCPNPPMRSCSTSTCKSGTQTCTNGQWGACTNCQGGCANGATQSCSTALCPSGTQTCNAQGQWGGCTCQTPCKDNQLSCSDGNGGTKCVNKDSPDNCGGCGIKCDNSNTGKTCQKNPQDNPLLNPNIPQYTCQCAADADGDGACAGGKGIYKDGVDKNGNPILKVGGGGDCNDNTKNDPAFCNELKKDPITGYLIPDPITGKPETITTCPTKIYFDNGVWIWNQATIRYSVCARCIYPSLDKTREFCYDQVDNNCDDGKIKGGGTDCTDSYCQSCAAGSSHGEDLHCAIKTGFNKEISGSEGIITQGLCYDQKCQLDPDRDNYISYIPTDKSDPTQNKKCLGDCDNNPFDDPASCWDFTIPGKDSQGKIITKDNQGRDLIWPLAQKNALDYKEIFSQTQSYCANKIHPNAPEVCDGVDNNCGGVCEGKATLESGTKFGEIKCNVDGYTPAMGAGGKSDQCTGLALYGPNGEGYCQMADENVNVNSFGTPYICSGLSQCVLTGISEEVSVPLKSKTISILVSDSSNPAGFKVESVIISSNKANQSFKPATTGVDAECGMLRKWETPRFNTLDDVYVSNPEFTYFLQNSEWKVIKDDGCLEPYSQIKSNNCKFYKYEKDSDSSSNCLPGTENFLVTTPDSGDTAGWYNYYVLGNTQSNLYPSKDIMKKISWQTSCTLKDACTDQADNNGAQDLGKVLSGMYGISAQSVTINDPVVCCKLGGTLYGFHWEYTHICASKGTPAGDQFCTGVKPADIHTTLNPFQEQVKFRDVDDSTCRASGLNYCLDQDGDKFCGASRYVEDGTPATLSKVDVSESGTTISVDKFSAVDTNKMTISGYGPSGRSDPLAVLSDRTITYNPAALFNSQKVSDPDKSKMVSAHLPSQLFPDCSDNPTDDSSIDIWGGYNYATTLPTDPAGNIKSQPYYLTTYSPDPKNPNLEVHQNIPLTAALVHPFQSKTFNSIYPSTQGIGSMCYTYSSYYVDINCNKNSNDPTMGYDLSKLSQGITPFDYDRQTGADKKIDPQGPSQTNVDFFCNEQTVSQIYGNEVKPVLIKWAWMAGTMIVLAPIAVAVEGAAPTLGMTVMGVTTVYELGTTIDYAKRCADSNWEYENCWAAVEHGLWTATFAIGTVKFADTAVKMPGSIINSGRVWAKLNGADVFEGVTGVTSQLVDSGGGSVKLTSSFSKKAGNGVSAADFIKRLNDAKQIIQPIDGRAPHINLYGDDYSIEGFDISETATEVDWVLRLTRNTGEISLANSNVPAFGVSNLAATTLEQGSKLLDLGFLKQANPGTLFYRIPVGANIISSNMGGDVFFSIDGVKLFKGQNFNEELQPANKLVTGGTCPLRPGCFLAGTKVLLSNGSYINIENVKQGDDVTAYDLENNKTVNANVTATSTRQVDKYLEIEYQEV